MDKNIKFKELAERRVNEAVKKISVIGNLSNRANYDYTDKQVRQIITELRREVAKLAAKFDNRGKDKERGFKFKD